MTIEHFQSHVLFYPAKGQRLTADLTLTETQFILAFSSADDILVQIHDCRFLWGGSETEMLEVHCNQGVFYLKDLQIIPVLLPLTTPAQHKQLQRIMKQSQPGRRVKSLFILLLVSVLFCVLTLWGSWRGLIWARNTAIAAIPKNWEAQLGEQAYTEWLQERPACQSKALNAALSTLADKLMAADKQPYQLRVAVLSDASINAVAFPGGYIAVNAGLIAKAPDARVLSAVLAHEAQHVYLQHGLKTLLNQMGLGLLVPVVLGDMGSVMLTLGAMSVGLANLGFSRTQEQEADIQAFALLQKARLSPKGFPVFFRWLSEQETHQGPAILSTHPLSAKRLNIMENLILKSASQKAITLDLNWKQLQAEAELCLTARSDASLH